MGVVREWLGIGGDPLGMSGRQWRTFRYSIAIAAVLVGVVNTVNVITIWQESPAVGLAAPLIWESTSAVTFILFLWIPWLAWRAAPPQVRPRWKLLLHVPGVLAFAVAHVGLFVLLRELIYWMAGSRYHYGSFLPHFVYELRKDSLGYALFIGCFTLVDYFLRQQAILTPAHVPTLDIRDGAKLTRVRIEEILAVESAGNYVEFILRDGRRLLMRSPLSVLETELSPRGFLRTHRRWLVNAQHVTAVKPEGSGDHAVELGKLRVPLSRRFREALVKLRGA
jgi:LytTr DNA-binding domain